MAAAEVAHVLSIVLHEPQAEKPLAEWVAIDAVGLGLKDDIDEVVTAAVPGHPAEERHHRHDGHAAPSQAQPLSPASADAAAVLGSPSPTQLMTMALVDKSIAAQRHLSVAGTPASDVAPPPPPTPAVPLLCLIVVVFWDGQTESSKATLAELKLLTERRWMMAHAPTWVDHVEVLVQALNAKRGEATIMNNKVALVASLRKKLQTSAMAGRGYWREGAQHRRASLYIDPNAAMRGRDGAGPAAATGAGAATASSRGNAKPSPPLPAPTVLGEADLSVAAVFRAVENGQGEAFFLISDRDRAGLDGKIQTLRTNCTAAEVGLAPVMMEPREVNVPASAGAGGASSGVAASGNGATSAATAASVVASAASTSVVAQEFLLRRRCPPATHLELRLAMCGNVDSGKSTLTSVLTRGCRDDGRGLARAFVFNHKHEAMTGRTSSVSENHLGFSAEGGVVNYALLQPHRTDAELRPLAPAEVALQLTTAASATGGSNGGAHVTRQFTAQELAARSAKVVTLYDLAGHERYLKTTVLGMTRNMPDYACIVISANNGIQRMTKEHLALCLALKLPFYIVITRIDATPPNVHDETLANIHKLLKIPTVKKLPYPVRRHDEVILAAKNLRHDRIAPIFEVSNVTGVGIPEVLQFINLLPVRKDWRQARTMPREMIIDSTFFVTGVGTVVGGIITQGVFRVNDTVLLGPDGFGHFRPVSIKSIHIKGIDSSAAEAGSDAALCLKKEKRSAIRKGNILADTAHPPKSYWQFEAEITILYHSTTIAANYEPVIHSTTVRQSARITYVAQEVLRTGDRSLARFHFLYRPEYMKEGQRLIFREGRTKGIGVVTKLICESDEGVLAKNKLRKKMQEKLHAPAANK